MAGHRSKNSTLPNYCLFLATSPKSNSAYEAINNAQSLVKETGDLPVPLQLRNAPTKLMKDIGYGKDYKYAHQYEGNFVKDNFLPDNLTGSILYQPLKKMPVKRDLIEKLRL